MTSEYYSSNYNLNGWKPQPPDHRDFKLADHVELPVTLPPIYSLQAFDIPVQDQGPEGSCTAFGTLGAMEFVAKKQGLTYPIGSRQAQYYWSRMLEGTQAQDAGAFIRDAIKVTNQNGMADSVLWPYAPGTLFTIPSSQVIIDATKRKSVKYVAVPNDGYSIKAAIASGYPVVVGFSVPQNFMTPEVAKSGMVPMPSGTIIGGHCVRVLGYDDSKSLLLFQNSWSTSWGQGGYGYMPYQFLQQLGADFWVITEVTGPVPNPPAPPTPIANSYITLVESTGKIRRFLESI